MATKTVLVTVSDDRMGRKNGLYAKTQDKIEWMLAEEPNKNLGIDRQHHFNFEDFLNLNHFGFYQNNKAMLGNIDAARNGRLYKPYFISYVLSTLNEGDYLIYNDCSPEIWDMPNYALTPNYDVEVIKQLTNKANGFLVAFVKWDTKHIPKGEYGRHTHNYFTMDLTLKEMYAESYKDSFLCASGMICIKKTDETINIVHEWLEYSKNPKCSCLGDPTIPNDTSYWSAESTGQFDTEGFKLGHRHDQSILSVLLNKKDAYYVDIQYTEMNPYNFLNFCRKDLEYTFINSNIKVLKDIPPYKKGDIVRNKQGITLNVYDSYLRDNIWILKVGLIEASCYETTLKDLL